MFHTMRVFFFLVGFWFFWSGFGLQSEEKKTTKPEPKLEQILPTKPEKDSVWGSEPETFKDLEILDLVDEKSSQRKWKEASSSYSLAIQGFEDAVRSIEKRREEASKEVFYEDRYEWQKKARAETREKEFAKQLSEARNQSVLHLIRGMGLLDKIENPKVKESDAYIDLKAGIYREYIKHQEAQKNYLQAVDFLERYIALDDRFEREPEPHRLMALAYEKLESFAEKGKKTVLAEEWKELKKRHLMRFAELYYGKESQEYSAIASRVARDY